METTALAIAPNPREMAMLATVMRQALLEMRLDLLKPGVDFGKIPGTTKDVLLKPGAEKLASAFKLYPIPKLLTTVEDWQGGFFYYRYQIDLMHRETGQVWGTGIGSCNSREKKYGYRWVTEAEVPADMDKDKLVKEDGMQTLTEFDFAVTQAKTSGDYAKPAEHWQMFKDAIASGKAKKVQKETKRGPSVAWEITAGVVRYRVPNPEIYDLVNTIDKMAFKRAYIAAVLNATNASEFFTQDMEDFITIALPDEDDVVEGVVTEITVPQPAPVVVEAKPKTAKECLSDGECKKKFEDICRELAIVAKTDHAPYLAALGNLKAYSDFEGTFDALCEKMRAIHRAINTPGVDPATATTASITPDQAAASLGNGSNRRIDTGANGNGNGASVTGGTLTTSKLEYNGVEIMARMHNDSPIHCGTLQAFAATLTTYDAGYAERNKLSTWTASILSPKTYTLDSDLHIHWQREGTTYTMTMLEIAEPMPMGGQVL